MIAVLLWLSGSVLSTLLLIAAAPACAQDWTVVPGVASRVEYSDNYFFTATGDLDGGTKRAEQFFQKACQGGSSPGCLNLGLAAAAQQFA